MRYFRPPNAFESFDPTPSVNDRCAHCMAGFELGQRIVTKRAPEDGTSPLRYTHLHEPCDIVASASELAAA